MVASRHTHPLLPSATLPAHQTTHLDTIHYSNKFILLQKHNGTSTGDVLWLGAQCLSAYLPTIHKSITLNPSSLHIRPRLLELGSGTGLAALTMHSLGWDVLATDTDHIIYSVLSPNIAMNYPDPLALDWLVPPISWDWSNPVAVASTTLPPSSTTDANLLQPPFDLIISSDTIYTSELVQPLLRTLHAAATISGSPPVYLCIERRDPALLDQRWGFTTTRIPRKKISKAMEKGGLKWNKEDWDGVEIWKLKLRNV
ncbi:hypothetical protein BGW80DRAFT_1471833 [Lactifluus volemus]|nr:hypothetical protein BGW80DRAFT_1471833 [Lactifluus volemus]